MYNRKQVSLYFMMNCLNALELIDLVVSKISLSARQECMPTYYALLFLGGTYSAYSGGRAPLSALCFCVSQQHSNYGTCIDSQLLLPVSNDEN